ncbi:MAG: cell division protein FtsX [Alphaproteobacteria bacterium]
MFSNLPPNITKKLEKLKNTPYIQRGLKFLGFTEYDLPFGHNEDSRFLITLIALMSFLAVLSTGGNLILNEMTHRWSSGLENKATIEVAAETSDGSLLSQKTIHTETTKISNKLANHSFVSSVRILTHEEIRELLSPWLGEELILQDIPLPGLIAVDLKSISNENLKQFKADLYKISKYARLETHHEWLEDLITFTSTLRNLALLVTILIACITVISISAGMHARLAIHKKEVELLHHMGATDSYIAKQFQRHAMALSLGGSIIGTFIGIIIIAIVSILSSNAPTPFIPALEISVSSFFILCTIPVITALIAIATSRFTVLRKLSQMP